MLIHASIVYWRLVISKRRIASTPPPATRVGACGYGVQKFNRHSHGEGGGVNQSLTIEHQPDMAGKEHQIAPPYWLVWLDGAA